MNQNINTIVLMYIGLQYSKRSPKHQIPLRGSSIRFCRRFISFVRQFASRNQRSANAIARRKADTGRLGSSQIINPQFYY